jgi:hypothetical protein
MYDSGTNLIKNNPRDKINKTTIYFIVERKLKIEFTN